MYIYNINSRIYTHNQAILSTTDEEKKTDYFLKKK